MRALGIFTSCLAVSMLSAAIQARADGAAELANGSWQNSRKLQPESLTEQLIDGRFSSQLRQKFDDMNRSYEWRERFSLTSLHDQEVRSSQSTSFAMTAFNELQASHVERGLRQVTETRPGESITDASRASIAVLGTAAALYVGIPIRLRASENSQITIRSRAYSGTASIELKHPGLLTSMSYSSQTSAGTRTPGSITEGERIGFQASKPLPFGSLTSGLTYGSTSGLMTASLSRPLLPNLALVGDTSKALSPGESVADADRPAQERLSILYHVSF